MWKKCGIVLEEIGELNCFDGDNSEREIYVDNDNIVLEEIREMNCSNGKLHDEEERQSLCQKEDIDFIIEAVTVTNDQDGISELNEVKLLAADVCNVFRGWRK